MSEISRKRIKHSPLFRGITEDELTAMLDCLSGSIRQYKKDASIFRWGDRISQIGLILKGNVHIVRESYWGKESLLARLGPGACSVKPMPVFLRQPLTGQRLPLLIRRSCFWI